RSWYSPGSIPMLLTDVAAGGGVVLLPSGPMCNCGGPGGDTRVSRLKLFVDQICTARKYTNRLLDATDIKDWFRQPHEGVTHIAWQVGHLAMADYRLGLDRIRGPRPEDESLISTSFLQLFGRDSVPAEAAKYPSLADIRNVFDR